MTKESDATTRDVTRARDEVNRIVSGIPIASGIDVLKTTLKRLEDDYASDPKNLDGLFERQLKRFRFCGGPAHIERALRKGKREVLRIAAAMSGKGRVDVPFLPVVPFRCLDLHSQAWMVPKAMIGDRYDFDPAGMRVEEGGRPRLAPHYVFGVRLGITGASRRGAMKLSLEEALAIAVQSYTKRPIWAPRTSFGDAKRLIPLVIVDEDTLMTVDVRCRMRAPKALLPTALRSPIVVC